MSNKVQIFFKLLMMSMLIFIIKENSWSQDLAAVPSFSSNGAEYPLRQDKEIKKSLKSILVELETRYGVNFVVDNTLIKDKFSKPIQNTANENLDHQLQLLLKPLELTFRKIDDKYYVIQMSDKKVKKIDRKTSNLHDFSSTTSTEHTPVARINSLMQAFEYKDIAVKGKVTSIEDGTSIPGVNVIVKGTTIGTTTNALGDFSLNIPDGNATLIFSFIGYVTEEVPVGGKSIINVSLASDIKQLSEVVVVGYGTQKKADITGAVTSISAKEITEYQAMNIDQALQGRLAGVQVNSKGGKPGANMSVQIRGLNSPNGNEPLYVIDGIPVGNGAGANHNSRTLHNLNQNTDMWARFDLSSLNPNDIASIDVLKDASATAIYGSLAANGVVVITTKRGQKGQTKIGFDSYYGIQQLSKKIDMLNSDQYIQLMQESRENAGQARIPLYDSLIKNGGYYNTNWQDEVYQQAPMQNYNLSLSGGGDKLSYFVSGGLMSQNGILGEEATNFDKYSIRLNIDNEVRDWLKLSMNVNGSKTKSQLTEQLNNYSPPFDALANLPFLPVRWNEGDERTFGSGIIIGGYSGPTNDLGNASLRRNPILEANEPDRVVEKNMIIGNINADIKLYKGLRYTTSIGGTYNDGYYHNWLPTMQFGTMISNNPNKLQTGRTSGYQTQFDQYFTYDLKSDVQVATLMVGHSITKNQWSTITAERDNFPFNTRSLSPGATTSQAGDGGKWENALQSFFGRFNYAYKDKYLFTATIRRDGSSKFPEKNKYANFPSFAIGWKVTNEEFMSSFSWLDNLKLRASWGQTGAQNIGDFAYVANIGFQSITQWGSNNSGLIPAAVHNNIPNTDVKWETTTQTNVGFDASFFRNRLNVNFDWYSKITDDLLLGSLPLPSYVGIGGPTVNLGTFENKGIELQMDVRNILNNQNLVWDAGVNFSRNRNNVASIGYFDESFGRAGYIGTSHGRTYVDNPWAMFYGHKVDGIFQSAAEIAELDQKAVEQATANNIPNPANVKYQPNNPQPGDIRYKDINGRDATGQIIYGTPDGRIDDADRAFIGNPHPDFIYGINTRLSYKGFDLSVFANGSQGNDIFNESRQTFEKFGNVGGDFLNQTTAALNRWRSTENPGDGKTPRAVWNDPNNNTRDSDRFVEDGSYIRIKNITLGYNLPKSLLSRASISNIRLYVSLNDYFTFTKYSWYNPDLGNLGNNTFAPGVDFSTYPNAKTILFGINMNL